MLMMTFVHTQLISLDVCKFCWVQMLCLLLHAETETVGSNSYIHQVSHHNSHQVV